MKWRKLNLDNQPSKGGFYLVKSHCEKGKLYYDAGCQEVRVGEYYFKPRVASWSSWFGDSEGPICFECNSYEWLDEEAE